MGRPYKIRDGCAFVLDGHRMTGGERIVLEDDVAAMHADKIDPIDAEAAPAAKKGEKKPKAAGSKKAAAAAGEPAAGEAPAAEA